MTEQTSKGLDSIPATLTTELTLERSVKMPPRKLIQYIMPVWGKEKFTIPIGKFTIKDQLAAQKKKWNLGPDKLQNNLDFLAWIAYRLIKKVDPYFDKTEKQLQNMFCEETFKELDSVFKESYSEDLKKKIRELQEKQGSPLLGKV